MARLSTRPSYASSARSSAAPLSTWTSDQMNHEPNQYRQNGGKGKGRAVDGTPELSRRASLPTPSSESDGTRTGQKRKRDEACTSTGESEEDSEEEEDEEEREQRKLTRYYDPDQDVDERRKVKKKSRALERDFQGTHRVEQP